MKKILIIPLLLIFTLVTYGAFTSLDVNTGTTFLKSANKVDTTESIQVKDFTYIYLNTFLVGSNNSDMTVVLQGKIGATWRTLKTYTTDSNITTTNLKTIRNPDTNYLGAASVIRLITTIHGGSDSTSLLKFYQTVGMWK